ncbi:phage tail protein [Chryseobacterium bernardetii]|uniref:phage tail protein n=1 Tax=Chryseobacterium bernardetii TaxID=1241978 RepID=UPI0016277835|nr:phage tail protein [Chryseobacterium bernardetii]
MGKDIIRTGQPIFSLVERGNRTIQSATISKTMLSDDTASFKVVSDSELDLKINDTVELYGQVYRINSLPDVNKINSRRYEYDIKAQGLMYDLLRCKLFNADGTGTKFETEFPLIGTIETFLLCIKNNMHRFAAEWEIGNFTEEETKTIIFGSDNCLSALQKICNEFKTDFWIKAENGKFVIHTGAFGNTIPVTFEYGKGKGLYSLSRKSVDDNQVINRLYAHGGTNNIKAGYRDFSNRLKLPNAEYIEDIELIDSMGLKEGEENFDEIYPKRTGKITKLGDSVFKFEDSTMDFNLNEKDTDGITTKYLIPGTSAKVHFNTGNLAGYEFEIKKGGYDHATKTFEIIPFKNDKDQSFPDKESIAFQLSEGDEYVLLDIVMPDIYVANAENELLNKATEQFNLLKQAKVSYDLEIDPEYIRGLSLDEMDIGDYIRVVDGPLGIDKVLRINSITRDFIQNGEYHDYAIKVQIADSYEINYNSQLILDIKDIKNVLSLTNIGKINLSRIGVKTTEELKNVVFDTDGYFDVENIRPNSIETNMISVGSRSQQISCSVVFNVNFEGDKNKVKVAPGLLYSQTFDKNWNIPAFDFTATNDQFLYVYGKCSKSNSTGSIVFSQTKYKFDEDPSYYYFLIGILHSVVEGIRVLSITVGTTTINGGLVRTGVISSLDGSTYFDLEKNKIKGNIEFEINSPAYQQVLNHIQLGSRNILRHSDFKNTASYYSFFGSGIMLEISNENETIKVKSNENKVSPGLGLGVQVLGIDFSKLKDKLLTLSFKVKSLNKKKFYTNVFSNQGIQSVLNVDSFEIENTWQKLSITFRSNNVDYSDFYFYCQSDAGFSTSDVFWIDEPVLEWGNISSDWSPAPEDIEETLDVANQNAIAAKIAAQNAQNSANTANALLADISSDNKLTPSEKGPLKIEWDTIQSEKPIVLAQAGVYNLSTSDYDSAYNELSVYITSNSILSDMSATTDVNGDYLRYVFSNYYTKKVALLKLISDKAKQLSDNAQNAANQAGVAALQAQQNALNAQNSANNAQLSANAANALLSDISNDDKLTPGEKYSLNTEWDTIQAEKSIIIAQAVNYNISHTDYDNAYNELQSYINSSGIFNDFTVTTDVNGDYLRAVFSDYYTKKVGLLKLVSDKAKQLADTAQNTANQAGQAALNAQNGVNNLQTSMNDVKTKTDNFVSINGGLLMGNILSVGDNQLNQRAFLSGVTDLGDTTGTSVRFAAGANYANKNTAPFRVQDNGKMIAQNADVKGKIDADSGLIGGIDGWKITSKTLTSTKGKIQFGVFNSTNDLISGISISEDNFPGSPTYKNRFHINSNRNEGNINNVAAVLSASGNNVYNSALEVSASGASGVNNAIYAAAGVVYISSQASIHLESLNNALTTNFEFGGTIIKANGFTGEKNIGGTICRFANGLFIM